MKPLVAEPHSFNDHPYHDGYVVPGVLKSCDGGATWKRQSTGLSNRSVHCLCVSPHDASILYVGTGGNGAFVGKDMESGDEDHFHVRE